MKTEQQLMQPCCPKCDSSDITFDASAYWNLNKQTLEYELVSIYCEECYDVGQYVLKPKNNPKTAPSS